MFKEKRIAQFEKYGMGVFIHFGLYSLLEKGEWSYHLHNRNFEEYRKLMDDFTVENLDWRAIARMVKKAGGKYITLTTRHHDGFSLYDTRGLSDFDAPHSAAKRDIIADFVEGCRAEGVVPFFYHTIIDWTCPLYKEDFHAYQQYLIDSVEVLCTQYGEIGGLWFDGFWTSDDLPEPWRKDDLYSMIRRHQPNAMIINNTGLHALGEVGAGEIDSVTFERGKPSQIDRSGKYVAMEMCQIFNSHWGIAGQDINYKSMSDILGDLADCRRYGANLLLNFGPKGDGSVRLIEQGYFEELSKWNEKFGVSLSALPCEVQSDAEHAFVIKDEEKYYLYVKNVPMAADPNVQHGGGIQPFTLSGCKAVRKIVNMDDGSEVKFTQDGDKVTVDAGFFNYGCDWVIRVAEVVFA